MALDKKGEIDVDATVDDIVDDILPQPEPEPKDPPDETNLEPEQKDPELKDPPEDKPALELKPGDEGYVAPVELKPGDEGYVEPVEAPKSWTKEMAPEFAKLPKPVQEYINKREAQVTEGISQYKTAAQFAQAVHGVVQPYMAHIQSRGNTIDNHLKLLLNADYVLSTGTPAARAEFLQSIMQNAGVTKEMLGETPAAKDPAVVALEKRVQELGGKLTESETAQLEEKRAEVNKAVDSFAANPKNIYFQELSDDIVKLIGAGYTLQDAYEKAVWANPVTRAKEQIRIDKDKEVARKTAAEEAALKAKGLKKSNVRETPSSRSAPTGLLGSIDDTLRSTLRTINERSN